jgi:hypothetical protein
MAVALFTTEQYIKDNSVINENVDVKYITSTIILCQKLYIKPLLGTALYDEINTEINAGSVSTDNQTLLDDYLQDVLLYRVLQEGMMLFTYKIENKSTVRKDSENSTPIDQDEMYMMRDDFKDKAELFEDRTRKFLLENATSTKYANYLDAGDGVDTIHPIKNTFTTGWALDDTPKLKWDTTFTVDRSKYDC